MATKFSLEEDEKLIDLVREHPPLYIVKSKSYKDYTIKNNIWKEIGEKLHKKDVECKLRWKSIRDYYQRKKRDYIKGTGTGSQRTDDTENSFPKKFQHLRFLDSTSLDERSIKTKTQDSVQQEPDASLLEEIHSEQLETDEDETQLSDIETTVTEHNNINSSKRYNDTEATNSVIPLKKKKTKNLKDKNIVVVSEMRKGREERNSLHDKTAELIDPAINMFFQSVAATVSKLSPINKAKIKAEIMSLVSKYEIEQIRQQAVPTSYQNQWSNNYSEDLLASHGYKSPSTSNSVEATSFVFSPKSENVNYDTL